MGLCLIFTTSNYLDGTENINSPIYNYNSCNFNKRKSLLFGSRVFSPPPQSPTPHSGTTPPCAYLLWYSSRILCSSPAWTTFWVVLVISSPSFMNFLVLVIVLYWLLLSYIKTIKNISIYIINTYIIDSTSPSNCFHNNHLLIYHTWNLILFYDRWKECTANEIWIIKSKIMIKI